MYIEVVHELNTSYIHWITSHTQHVRPQRQATDVYEWSRQAIT